ncbi:MAG: hypothetical protein H0V36_06870 [Chloroflexi bacterium]|nr:hypothetical protein [Chloroflexota bacterium]
MAAIARHARATLLSLTARAAPTYLRMGVWVDIWPDLPAVWPDLPDEQLGFLSASTVRA